ncbi:flagellar basal body-associated FliL family protein [Breznakiellaceae bacterium SP9]
MKERIYYIYQFLLLTLIILVLCIAGGTIYVWLDGLNASAEKAAVTGGSTQPQIKALSPEKPFTTDWDQTFNGIGRIRAACADQNSAVVLSIRFPYSAEDKDFLEELSLRVGTFRNITADYFGVMSKAELTGKTEAQIKSDLLQRFNAILRLGQIQQLFFSDFIILE